MHPSGSFATVVAIPRSLNAASLWQLVFSRMAMFAPNDPLVLIGVTEQGDKELLGIEAGFRESELTWKTLLLRLVDQGLSSAPELAIGDGALGFWKALPQVFPSTRIQRCWVHKTVNVLNTLPKSQQPQAKSALKEIYTAATKVEAEKAFDRFILLPSFSERKISIKSLKSLSSKRIRGHPTSQLSRTIRDKP